MIAFVSFLTICLSLLYITAVSAYSLTFFKFGGDSMNTHGGLVQPWEVSLTPLQVIFRAVA
jgi:ABC-type glycerol-3-phosphate transport system permease component